MIQKISLSQYEKLTQHSHAIKLRRGLPSVLLNKDNLIIKHIYKRKLFSSSTLWPYALRFKKNSIKLQQLNVQTPQLFQIYYYPILKCYLVVYSYISGSDLQTLFKQEQYDHIYTLPYFIAKLHQKGIYFRDLHLNNIIKNDHDFALIDLHSVKIYYRSLGILKRAKNLAHLFNKELHATIWTSQRIQQFLSCYIVAAEFTEKDTKKLLSYLDSLTNSSNAFFT